MREVVFEVIGKVQGKGRPRVSTRGGFARAYTPENTANYENWIKTCYLQVAGSKNSNFDGAVKLDVTAITSPPKSYSKKKTKLLLDTSAPYLSKPDGDNIVKCVGDALNGLAYKDDSQIYDIHFEKKYGIEDKLIVKIIYMED